MLFFHLNVKENQHATKCSLLVEKQNDFSMQMNVLICSREKVRVRTAGVIGSIELQKFGCQTES